MTEHAPLARARVHVVSLRLARDELGRKIAHLRLHQPSTDTVVSAKVTRAPLIEAIFAAGKGALWSAVLDRTDRTNTLLLDARRAAA